MTIRVACWRAAVAVGCSAVAAVPTVGQELRGPVAVDISGLDATQRTNVEGNLSLARLGDRALATGRVRDYVSRVEAEVGEALIPLGYYEASAQTEFTWSGSRWDVAVSVDPGPPVLIGSVDVSHGLGGVAASRMNPLAAEGGVQSGAVLNHGTYEILKRTLLGTALDLGYLEAAFDSSIVRVDRRARRADIVLAMNPGPRYRLGEVVFEQDAVDSSVLQRLVRWRPGDVFEGRLLLELQESLSSEPYVRSVEIVPNLEAARGDTVPIQAFLTMERPQRYSVGGGYGSDTGPRATLSAEFRRLNRRGHSAEVDLRLSFVERRATGRWLVPLRGRHASLLTFSGGFADLTPETSDTQTFFGTAAVSGLMGAWRSEFTLGLQRSDFEVGSDSGITTLILIGAGVTRTRADDRLDPTRGSLLRFRGRVGPDVSISEASVLELGFEGRIVRSPTSRTRVRGRVELGYLETNAFSRLPGTLRYFAGGDRSVRGYGYRTLGPSDEDGEPVGGDRLGAASLEGEFLVWPAVGFALFVDAGNAGRGQLPDPEAGAGFGVRWRAPIGIVRFDLAWAVTQGGRRPRFHLTLGPEL